MTLPEAGDKSAVDKSAVDRNEVVTACPLCAERRSLAFHRDRRRPYRRCPCCRLVFVPRAHHLSQEQERAHYDTHENSPDDPAYRRFLARLEEPLAERLGGLGRGLDFGCGPGPTLSVMLEERGHRMALFDRYFAPDASVLAERYDFITATEVVEHLSRPGEVLDHLWSRLVPGGWLGLMTALLEEGMDFSAWHYKNDPTHISFFAPESFLWLGRRWGAAPEFAGNGVVFFQRP